MKKIEIKNYKSLEDVSVGLGKFNVIIGPNMSGKSNFLDSLRFLSQATAGPTNELPTILRERGGFEKILFWRRKNTTHKHLYRVYIQQKEI
ncbi:MAG: hypothetical protein DRO11_04550 [Methanobacteriota archaeon]|nr:MAG: hypothetical protein DRO11_04550 [Euryarchaeota archaeon]